MTPSSQSLAAIKRYVSTSGVPDPALIKMAKLGVVIDQWMKQADVAISAVQCWTSLEENLGMVPCTIMSMMSDNLLSSACETDVCGMLGMHVLQLASARPARFWTGTTTTAATPIRPSASTAAICPNISSVKCSMDFQEIIAGTVGKENTFGTAVGKVKSGAMSFARFSTVDTDGVIRGYVGEGKFTDDSLETFGGAGVVEIPDMQKLLRYICENGFEHHVAANFSSVASAVEEAAQNYLGWETYHHVA